MESKPGTSLLMQNRIQQILLVSSSYDRYILEEEGLLYQRVSNEYAYFHLTHSPVITQVPTGEDAIEMVKERTFDLVITQLRIGVLNAFAMGRKIKDIHPDLPVVLITSETGRISWLRKKRDTSGIDKVFYWHGDAKLFLVIIKSIEDEMNADHDLCVGQVRLIILAEDSPHFYSHYLPTIYTEIMEQTRLMISQEVSEEEKYYRMSTRPKILLVETYEDAIRLYMRYRDNVLGIISDLRFPRAGELDPKAGTAFAGFVKKDNPGIPILIQSREPDGGRLAAEVCAFYVAKNSPRLLQKLRRFVLDNFGFGDFIFHDPATGEEIARAQDLLQMEEILRTIPSTSLEYHSKHNHFSNWLFARGEFDLAARLRPKQVDDFDDLDELRGYLIRELASTREKKQRGVIVDFSEKNFDLTHKFIRFGSGSIGGKARGIIFVGRLLNDLKIEKQFPDAKVSVPKTAVIGTDVFDRFLESTDLYEFAVSCNDDDKIARRFLEARLHPDLLDDLRCFLRQVDYPLAVRSSSLSEDSQSQPFAGLYSTYMLPNNHPDLEERLSHLSQAIRLIYSSTFFQDPKAYLEANALAIEGEKMGIILQEMVGHRHGDYFYPDLAGVAQSYNFFPVSYMKPEDGVAQVVLGLGTMAVQGGRALRFSPRYPGIKPQLSSPRDVLSRSQRAFYALDLTSSHKPLSRNEKENLALLDLAAAETHGTLDRVGGVYSVEDDMIYEGLYRKGKRVVTFSRLLQGKSYPLAPILTYLLEMGNREMGGPVEIEFAVNFNQQSHEPPQLFFLQIRPLVTGVERDDVSVDNIAPEKIAARTDQAMGHGVISHIKNIVYVRPDRFDISRTTRIAEEIGRVNSRMVEEREGYLLIGLGRWGTVNPQLGVPVAYAQISHAKVIAEVSIDAYNIEPSQGTHFFHNIISNRIGYLSINASTKGKDFLDWDWLDSLPAEEEGMFVRHLRLSQPIQVRLDGHTGRGVILKS